MIFLPGVFKPIWEAEKFLAVYLNKSLQTCQHGLGLYKLINCQISTLTKFAVGLYLNFPDEGKEGYITIGELDEYQRQKYLGKEKDSDKVDLILSHKGEKPEGDTWIWERSTTYRNGSFTLKNKHNGKILTAPGQCNVVVKDDETYFSCPCLG